MTSQHLTSIVLLVTNEFLNYFFYLKEGAYKIEIDMMISD